MSYRVRFNIRQANRMVRDFRRLANDPRVTRNAERAGLRAVGGPIARNLRRAIKAKGLVDEKVLVKGIITKLKVTRNGRVSLRIGPKTKVSSGVKPSRYFHLADKGTEPHFQPNAYRRIGGRLIKMPAGAMHPGSKPRNALKDAESPTRKELNSRYRKAYGRVVEREMKKKLSQNG